MWLAAAVLRRKRTFDRASWPRSSAMTLGGCRRSIAEILEDMIAFQFIFLGCFI
jgi:hypothetical protein